MKYAFISGIPAAGKSYLATKIAKEAGIQYFSIDKWRRELKSDPELKKWVDFFWDKDEKEYWRITSCEQHWNNLKKQSEAFWPAILEKIKKVQESGEGAIFEGVNILPHLAHKDLDFQGVFLFGESIETILERNKQKPRWGRIEELQVKEAEVFWNCERPRYKEEAEKYGFETFTDSVLAENKLLELLRA